MYRNLFLICFLIIPGIFHAVNGQSNAGVSNDIRVNQIGYYPDEKKTAVAVDAESGMYYIVTKDMQDTVFAGPMQPAKEWDYGSGEYRTIDFTRFNKEGEYRIAVKGKGVSYPFEISENIFEDIYKGIAKGFYYQRASTALPEKYAGKWARPKAHPDKKVYIHPSAAHGDREAGDVIESPKGWYDAGDYNKYIVNSSITVFNLMTLYEHFPDYVKNTSLDIPEKDNNLPDLLDEVLYNVRWMLTMQDPQDGGIYHKMTTANFEGHIAPHEANKKRYVVQKSTAASLDFAASMAQAARVFRKFEDELPGLADSCLKKAKKAYQWAQDHPNVYYEQDSLNKKYDPDIKTGEYGASVNNSYDDEFFWAASELFVTTGNTKYYNKLNGFLNSMTASVPNWQKMGSLALISLSSTTSDKGKLPEARRTAQSKLIKLADNLAKYAGDNPFKTPMGTYSWDFVWGGNSNNGNEGFVLITAYRITDKEKYLDAAIGSMDYVFGKNGTGYSFVTGFGEKSPENPHHRSSYADNVEEPVPGLVVGGPHDQQAENESCSRYPSTEKGTRYLDKFCSYSTNELAINYMAPYVYLAGALEAIKNN